MCLALYLFTNDCLPDVEWSPEDPGVYVHEACVGEDLNALNWPHAQERVYYIGGYQGCGCGWAPLSDCDDPPDLEAKRRDRLELARLLSSVDLKTSWLVICWSGDQAKSMAPIRTITLEQVANPQFELVELQQYRVAEEGAPPGPDFQDCSA